MIFVTSSKIGRAATNRGGSGYRWQRIVSFRFGNYLPYLLSQR